MGFRYRKSARLGPARLNIGRRGITSVSFGKRGFTTNVNRGGVRGTVGLPGSGLSYSRKLGGCCFPVLVVFVTLPVAAFLTARQR